MNLLLIYAVKVAVYLLSFYLVYTLLLSRDTTYGRNRAFILLSLAASLLLPLITLQTIRPHNIQFFGKLLSEVFISPDGRETLNSGLDVSTPLEVVFIFYIFGVIAFIFKLLIDLLNLLFLIVRQKNKGSRIIKFHGFNTAGFSAMGHIFINIQLSQEEAREIIKHEKNHLQQNHFFDIIFIELITAFQWFNPAIHLFNRSLRAIHEYQADNDCLSGGITVVSYQNLLLNQVFNSKTFNLTNSFSNPSLIKKRMIMMTKKRTSALANIKLLLVIPVTSLVIFAISAYKEIPVPGEQPVSARSTSQLTSQESTNISNPISKPVASEDNSNTVLPPPPPPPPPSEQSEKANEKAEPEPFVVVEEMPQFPGGDAALLKYIGENTLYPSTAKEQNIQGRVIVRFCITAGGKVDQISVLKGVSPDLDTEAMRVVSSLPDFNPGKQDGMPVPVWYMVPITFTLK